MNTEVPRRVFKSRRSAKSYLYRRNKRAREAAVRAAQNIDLLGNLSISTSPPPPTTVSSPSTQLPLPSLQPPSPSRYEDISLSSSPLHGHTHLIEPPCSPPLSSLFPSPEAALSHFILCLQRGIPGGNPPLLSSSTPHTSRRILGSIPPPSLLALPPPYHSTYSIRPVIDFTALKESLKTVDPKQIILVYSDHDEPPYIVSIKLLHRILPPPIATLTPLD